MNCRLMSKILVVELALLTACAASGWAGQDETAGKKTPNQRATGRQSNAPELLYEGKTFEQWRQTLMIDLSPRTRVAALKALAAFGRKGHGPQAVEAILQLMRQFESEMEEEDGRQEKVEVTAAYALVKIGPPALPLLLKAVQDPNTQLRLFAIKAWPVFDNEQAKIALPALLQAIKAGDVPARLAAIEAVHSIEVVHSIDARDTRFCAALVETLKDTNPLLRRTAAQQLRMFDRAARIPAVSALAEALRDRDAEVRGEAESALKDLAKELGTKAGELMPGLLAALKGTECNELHELVAILTNLGSAARDAVPMLTQWLKTPPPKSRYAGLDNGCGCPNYSLEKAFQGQVYDALEKITGKKPSGPRPDNPNPGMGYSTRGF